MDKILEICKKNKKIIMTIFLIGLFCYYLIWTVSQPYNSCPDEKMKWDICKYIAEHNSIPDGRDESIRDSIWGISYAFQPLCLYEKFQNDLQGKAIYSHHPPLLY